MPSITASYSMIPLVEVQEAPKEVIIQVGRPKGMSLTGVGVKRGKTWYAILRGDTIEDPDWIEKTLHRQGDYYCFEYEGQWYVV